MRNNIFGFVTVAMIALLAWSLPATAQREFQTPNGIAAEGAVQMCSNGASPPLYVPCNSNSAVAPATKQGSLTPLGFCQLSVTTAAQTSSCSGGIPSGATWALICNEGAAARYRDDGTAPTASVGMPLSTGSPGAPVCINYFAKFSALQWIAQSGTSVLDISFYK